ncbi:MAG: TRAP transporter fused permease subunit [Verrucomicrobia bacterium]|nr:TRAP transporter fused permease subunit [Verrucomicrobiota bacterium]
MSSGSSSLPARQSSDPRPSEPREAQSWDKAVQLLQAVISCLWLGFQTYILFFPQPALAQCPLHLGFALALVLLSYPLKAKGPVNWRRALDIFLLAGVLFAILYYSVSRQRLMERMEGVDPILNVDLAMGVMLTAIVLECVRRVTGWSLLSVILLSLALGFVGTVFPGWVDLSWIPEMLKFSGFSLSEAVENFTMTANGLLGVTTSTSVMFVFYFVAFGAVYAAIGGGQLFTDIGLTLAGKQKGGAAKASVISSGLMGTVSGSAVANVAADGIFTIPLMKATGYSPTHAAAVEAVASTGGQLMPPVMGVAAFVMAELLQVPYTQVALAGVIPALAFYLSIFLVVDLNARKTGAGVLTAHAPKPPPILPRLYLLLPPLLLVVLLALGKSASYSAALATGVCIAISVLKEASRLDRRGWINTVMQTCKQAAEVAVPIAAIGIIIEVAVQSNLALKFSILLVELGAGNTLASLALIVVGCIVMGMGLPTVAAYMIGAIFFVPVMIDLGISPLAAHFFVMYYSVLSMVTPPVALASITAAGLAKADSTRTGLKAFQLSLVAFFVPFMFVFEPALLAQGPWDRTLTGLLALALGALGWAVALEGHLRHALSALQRCVVGCAGLMIFLAPLIVDRLVKNSGQTVGGARFWVWSSAIGLLVISLLWCILRKQKETADANS